MIKRTLYFGNPAYLHLVNSQLHIKLPEVENNDTLTEKFKKESTASIPIEDIGVIVIDHQQITITSGLIAALTDNNVAIVSCNASHLPQGLMLPMYAHHTFTEKMRFQIDSSLPLIKNLWQQTVMAKIRNQRILLASTGINADKMKYWENSVGSGDPDNYEGRAAAYYWENLFQHIQNFTRRRFGDPPNNLLNYGYAILRAVVARSLVASGMLLALGIHHRNKYNPYCLADDIMEPYRPYVDKIVIEILKENPDAEELTKEIKIRLLQLPVIDIIIDEKSSPLMVGMQRTTASLASCFEGETRKILYPIMEV